MDSAEHKKQSTVGEHFAHLLKRTNIEIKPVQNGIETLMKILSDEALDQVLSGHHIESIFVAMDQNIIKTEIRNGEFADMVNRSTILTIASYLETMTQSKGTGFDRIGPVVSETRKRVTGT